MKPLKFGCGFDLRNPKEWYKPWPELYAEHIDFVAWTESLGFEHVWYAEHHGIEDGYMPSPLVMGAAVAARTSKIRIGTGVALAPFYHPVRLAEDCAVLDNISNGRFELTLGIGYLPFEANAYGFDIKSRAQRSDEILHIVRRLWEGETVTFEGKYHDIRGARIFPRPVQKPGIPLWIGGVARPGLRRAARYGDGYSGPIEHWPAYLEELTPAGKPQSAGRIQSVDAADMWIFVTDDPEEALEEVAPHTFYQLNQYAEWQQGLDWAAIPKLSFEEFKMSGMIRIFTPDEAIDYLRRKRELAPFEAFCMQCPSGFPLTKYAKYVESFATKVMPAFR